MKVGMISVAFVASNTVSNLGTDVFYDPSAHSLNLVSHQGSEPGSDL